MGFNFGGLGKLQGMLGQLKEGEMGKLLQKLPLDKLPLEQLLDKLPLDKVLSNAFIQKYTPFKSLADFLQQGGFTTTSAEGIKSLPADRLNEHVNNTTSFGSVKELLLQAVEYYTQKK